MNRSTLSTVALLHAAKMPITDWRRHLGAAFGGVRPYLVECTGELTGTIPCPRSGQRLHVAQRGRKYVAFPEDGFEGDSGQVTDLKPADVALWALDRDGFERGLCGVLDIAPASAADAGGDGTRLIGTIGTGETRKRVYLCYAGDERTAMNLCVGVAQANRQRCCVVLPSFFPLCDEYLRRCEHDMIVLDEWAVLTETGLAAKRRETTTEAAALLAVDVIGDYKSLKLRDGTVVDLSRRTKCRAFVRHLHQRRKNTGNRDFFYDEEIAKLNAGQQRILIQSGDFKYGLFRGIHQHFELLFTVLDRSNGRYRINF
jgi:hypothetical protein